MVLGRRVDNEGESSSIAFTKMVTYRADEHEKFEGGCCVLMMYVVCLVVLLNNLNRACW